MNSGYAFLVREVSAPGLVRADEDLGSRLGYSASELGAHKLIDWIHPDDRARLEQAVAAGCGFVAARHATKSGDWAAFNWRIQRMRESVYALGEPDRQGVVSEEIRWEDQGKDQTMNDMLVSIALIVESKNPGMRCSILLVDPKTQRIAEGVGPSLPDEYNAAVEGLEIGPSVGSCGTAAFWNVPVIVSDIETDPLWRDLRDAARIAGVSACWSHPITTLSGEVLGAMALYSTVPSAPEPYQMDGLAIAARMVGLAIDRSRLEAQVRQAAKMEALGVLAGGIAHDFNNLLGVILGNADLALSITTKSHPAREMLDDIVTASRSAADLCNQLLAYAGRSVLSTEVVECNAMIQELSKLLYVSLSKKAKLHLQLEGRFGVLADASQLRQVLMNLITNAAEAIGNAEGEVVVSTHALTLTDEQIADRNFPSQVTPGEYAAVTVKDNGCGMDAETRQRIFDPFFSTKDDGRGLGLAAVKGIVEAHGWVLEVESKPQHGTTFTLMLPRTDVVHVATPKSSQEKVPEVVCVLVVDDEPGVLKVVTRILSSAGIDVLEASDGEEAIETYRMYSDEIDCVLLDLNMPKLDGEEVFRELQSIRQDVRVLLTSGFTEQEVLDRFRGGGLRGALQKPFGTEELLDKVLDAIH
jgi:signal transduction histidine kinase/CheY-like chemotaxis protein